MTEEEQIDQRLTVLTALTAAQIQHGGVESVDPETMAMLGTLAGALVYTNRKNQQVFAKVTTRFETEEQRREEEQRKAAAAAQELLRKIRGDE